MERKDCVEIRGFVYCTPPPASDDVRVKYETTVYGGGGAQGGGGELAEQGGLIGSFEIEGSKGQHGLGFDEAPGAEPMHMTIHIEDGHGYRGQGISKRLIHSTCEQILRAHRVPGVSDPVSKLVFIDTDASDGFWPHMGVIPTEAVRNGWIKSGASRKVRVVDGPDHASTEGEGGGATGHPRDSPHSRLPPVVRLWRAVWPEEKEDKELGEALAKGPESVAWLTEDQADLIKKGYGDGYEGVISLGALCEWAARVARPPKQGNKRGRDAIGGARRTRCKGKGARPRNRRRSSRRRRHSRRVRGRSQRVRRRWKRTRK